MTDEAVVGDAATVLGNSIPLDRFGVVTDPLGWRCRSCSAEVTAEVWADGRTGDVARLAESAADHAMYCGRCDD